MPFVYELIDTVSRQLSVGLHVNGPLLLPGKLEDIIVLNVIRGTVQKRLGRSVVDASHDLVQSGRPVGRFLIGSISEHSLLEPGNLVVQSGNILLPHLEPVGNVKPP